MRILLTNDDGIDAPGLQALAKEAEKQWEVTIVAPVHEQSGVAHSITLARPLRIVEVQRGGEFLGYGVHGTPVDCVKLAVNQLMEHKPDLIISGVNFGMNSGPNVLYSATVAAAVEGAMHGIPSIAASVQIVDEPDYRFGARVAVAVARMMLDHLPAAPRVPLWSVNVPGLPPHQIKGIRLTRQCVGLFKDCYDERLSPRGQRYFWLESTFRPEAITPNGDVKANVDGYISVTPLRYDLTDAETLGEAESWDWGRLADNLRKHEE